MDQTTGDIANVITSATTTLSPALPAQLQYIHLSSTTPQDSKYILDAAALFHAYIIFYKWDHDLEKCEAWLRKRLATGAQIFLCYYTPDKTDDANGTDAIPVGFTQLYPSYSSIAMEENWLLNDLYVSETHRHLKIGQAFLRHVINWADSNGAFKLFIETTLNNPRAQYLYPKMGFVEYTRHDDGISYCMKFDRSKNKTYRSYYE